MSIISEPEEKCVERCDTVYDTLKTLTVRVQSSEECRQLCENRGDYAYGLECPITDNVGNFDVGCFCFQREAFYLDSNILPLTDCMGQPTNVMTQHTQWNGNNGACTGPYLENEKGMGGACRNIIRRTSKFRRS